eukprot:15455535-Alexandrium_andersonii.AAC.1
MQPSCASAFPSGRSGVESWRWRAARLSRRMRGCAPSTSCCRTSSGGRSTTSCSSSRSPSACSSRSAGSGWR